MEIEGKKGAETPSEDELIKKSRAISVKEGCANAVSVGVGTNYISPYALALGASNSQIGLLTSVPSLLGSFFQFYSIKAMFRRSRKRIVFSGVLAQAVSWLFIIFAGIMFFVFHINSGITPNLLIVIYTVLVIFGASTVPAWSSWMKDLVSKGISGEYFGKRNRICNLVTLISMLAAGFLLDYFKKTKLFLGFMILFAAAFVFRAISAYLFTRKYEPQLQLEKGYYFNFWQFLKKMPQNNFGKFVIFMSLINLATAIASPFFAVYMLKQLNFSYVSYISVIMTSILAGLLFMPAWGRFADSYGNSKVVKICSFLIIMVPFLWLLSPIILVQNPKMLVFFLIAVEAFSGFAWSGFNLSSSNFIYDAVTRQRMALCVAYSNILNGIGVFIGATLGGLIASMHFTFFTLTPLLFVFMLSGIVRLIITLAIVPKIKEVREVKKFGIKDAKEKFMTLSPQRFIQYLDINILKPRSV